jgi:hypothetical protein
MAVTRKALFKVLQSIPVWPDARTTSQIYGSYDYNTDAGAPTKESQQRRIKERLRKIAENPVGGAWLNYEDGKPLRFYWDTQSAKNHALHLYGEVREMSLSNALAYNLIEKHLAHLLPPDDAEALGFFFRAAEHRLHSSSSKLAGRQPASDFIEINPLTVPMTRSERNTENYRILFNAIEKHQVITAKYESVHSMVPDEIMFSPQKICMLGTVVRVQGFLHNPSQFGYLVKPGKEGVHRMLDIDSMEILSTSENGYVSIPPLTKSFTLKAYIHKWVMRNLKQSALGKNQSFEKIADNSKDARLLKDTILNDSIDNWRLFSCQVDLPRNFREDGYDGWFLANMIGQLGSSMLVLEPEPVVKVLNERLDNLIRFRNNIEQQ